jgi:3-hydroxyacyl-CoA dehydrogenase/enoyl-CoA hydratase/3-hydroxybutyryl-CoA epimerase
MQTIRSARDGGILTLTIDVADRSMNVLTDALLTDLAAAVEDLASDASLQGAIITSAKNSFIAGADILNIVNAFDDGISLAQAYESSQLVNRLYRRLETCGKPVVAAINGLALGGGFELCLACHYRLMADTPRTTVGLPEVKIGLLPGGGGTQRVPRLIGISHALEMLTDGRQIGADEALKLGLVHEKVAPEVLLVRAREWLLAGAGAQQPWDRPDFKVPGGVGSDPRLVQLFSAGAALAARDTQRNLPAVPAILSCVYEGTLLPIDAALRVEARYFARLLAGPVARNLMRTMFVNKGRADKLARRPTGVPKSVVKRLGVLGAGMMGSGIAYASAIAGMEVVLLDTTADKAAQGKAYSEALLRKEVGRGRRQAEETRSVLSRIQPTTRFEDLAACDLIIEAVFEDRGLKADVTAKTQAVTRDGIVFASNTSTLPISGLAQAATRPERFIGLHFFSPVDRMPLVEIILGPKTSQETLAHALDFVGQIRKTPIVVNDSRGFYTSRVFSVFVHEGLRMLEEGVRPALIENSARMAGMPVGPLAVSDEVTIELLWKVIRQSETDLGAAYIRPAGYAVVERFAQELKRLGKRFGAGFYDYPANARKHLWSGLAQQYPLQARQPGAAEVRTRLLTIQALETARCMEENVITDPADADLGSILGWGFPPWTGGTISYIETVGLKQFVADCDRLARDHGERFRVSAALRQRAERGGKFHARVAAPSSAG